MSKIHASIKHEIECRAKHMDFEVAVRKVKEARLNRHDAFVDEVAKKIKAA